MFLLDKCKDGVGDVAQFRGDFFEAYVPGKLKEGRRNFQMKCGKIWRKKS